MTEYLRDSNNQIQASLACRIGKIEAQYSKCIESYPKEKRYDVTLHICLLQNLLTSCSELVRAMKNNKRKKSFFAEEFTEASVFWGLTPKMIVTDTFVREKIVHFDVITHLRDALSHPTILDLASGYISTGYTTIEPIEGEIAQFAFISSPDVRKNHPKYYENKVEAELQLKQPGYPLTTYVKQVNDPSINYQVWSENAPYMRVFRIDVPVDCLKTLLVGLSNHLAQPILRDWDGITT
ncbi:MAG: hypothetical protein Q8K00_06500 [Syntrophales bacterium]|nr:hypothetical protein [Syntrophales bacterium]